MSDEDTALQASTLLPKLDEDPGPLPDLSEPAAQALTWRVVERWSNAREASARAEGPAPQLTATEARGLVRRVVRRHARRRLARALAAASFVLGAGGLAFGAVRVWERLPTTAQQPAETSRASRPERARSKVQRRSAELPANAANTEAPDIPPSATGLEADSVSHNAADRELHSEPVAVSASAADRSTRNAVSLEHANGLRAARAWQAAQRSYLQIASSALDPRERYVASVAAAALCLQHTGDPQRALSLYQSALRAWPRGDLSEEIRLGIAHAQRALAHPDAEADALRDFLSNHPGSADAGEARRRLIELIPTR